MNNELDVALNVALDTSALTRTAIYDEIDDINSLINNYSSYIGSEGKKGNSSFNEFMHIKGESFDIKENGEVVNFQNETSAKSKLDYFGKSLDGQEVAPVVLEIKPRNESDTLRRYIFSKGATDGGL